MLVLVFDFFVLILASFSYLFANIRFFLYFSTVFLCYSVEVFFVLQSSFSCFFQQFPAIKDTFFQFSANITFCGYFFQLLDLANMFSSFFFMLYSVSQLFFSYFSAFFPTFFKIFYNSQNFCTFFLSAKSFMTAYEN